MSTIQLGEHVSKVVLASDKFIVSTGVEKPNTELRKLIRSQCMIGKNKGRKLPPRERKPERRLTEQDNASTLSKSLVSATRTTPDHNLPVAVIPRNFGFSLSSISLASDIEPGEFEVILKFSSIAKTILFPLESCILFERRAELWIAPLAMDPAYLHSMIFAAQYYFDAVLLRTSSPTNRRSTPHFFKTVQLVRDRLAHDTDIAKLSYTTMAAVMSLAAQALWGGNREFGRYHMKGLKKMVELRGGVDSLQENPKLLMEIFRCDMGIALEYGSETLFFNNSSRKELYPPFPDLKSLLETQGPTVTDSALYLDELLNPISSELATTWQTMAEFCSLINFATESGQFISIKTLLETFSSTMYRLINMKFDAGSSDEAIRLGLLAFSCSVFLQWQRLGLSFPPLVSAFRSCLATMDFQQMAPHRALWLLTVAAALVFKASDDWWLKPLLHVKMSMCEIGSWKEMRYLLKRNLWISLVHDKLGEYVYVSTVSYTWSHTLGEED